MSSAPAINQETALMQMIRAQWGGYIHAAVAGTSLPEAFIAALAANECSGNPAATRYEGAELGQFALVLAGRRDAYQGIGKAALVGALRGVYTIESGVQILVNYCTSWGPTQIMGWQALKRGYALSELSLPSKHFARAAEILMDFLREFYPGVVVNQPVCGGLFHCWNAGAPQRPTTDPNYASKGLARMKIYEALS